MIVSRLSFAFAFAGVSCLPCAAADDLAQINRSIHKEPVYQTTEPKYCLLVFGPEATTRV